MNDSRSPAAGTGLPPLAGIRVVDFGHYLAGPLAGMLLADQGAEVIKIDRPGHPSCATPAGAVFNRGKQVVELDLKSTAGREAAQRLVAAADVVIENFRPGVMDRLALGAAALTAANPRLVYLSLPGFGAGEKLASVRAFEGVLNAATGVYTDLHSIRRALHAPPQYTPIPLASAYGAVHGAIAVTLALYGREESGRGEAIEVPLAGAAMSAMGAFLLRVGEAPARYGKRPNPASDGLRERMRHADADERRRLIDEQRPWLPTMFDSYQAGDGGWVFVLAGNSRRNSVQLVKALGIYDALIADGMVDVPPYPDLTRPNNIQDVDGLSRKFKKILRDRMTAAFRQKPADDWTPIMREHGVPFSVHRGTQEWLHRPETDAAALTVEVDDPVHGAIRQFGVQTSLGRTAERWHVPRPARSGDLAALLRSLPGATGNGSAAASSSPAGTTRSAPGSPRTPTDGARSEPRGHILAGIKVLDLSTVLAGPCCAQTLAEYGADVIKIDAPDPYFLPSTACMLHLEVGQGKRSMILDLKQEAGKRLFEQLAAGADVIVHNFRPGVAERLGIDHASLARINSGHRVPQPDRVQRAAPRAVDRAARLRPGAAGRHRNPAALRRPRRAARAARLRLLHRLHYRLLRRLRHRAGPAAPPARGRRRPGVHLPGAGRATGAGAVRVGHRRRPARRRPAGAGGPGSALAGAPVPRRRRLARAHRPARGPAAPARRPRPGGGPGRRGPGGGPHRRPAGRHRRAPGGPLGAGVWRRRLRLPPRRLHRRRAPHRPA